MTVADPLAVAGWPSIGLDEIEREAALLTRVDRKYVVTRTQLADVLNRIGDGLRVLDIDGERHFGYRTVYFDTPELACYRAAAAGRRQRFKLRTRAYVTTGTSWLEVKIRDRRGRTDKHRVEHDGATDLDVAASSFLDGFELVRPYLAAMQPTIETTYRRSTFVCSGTRRTGDDVNAQRVTVDVDVTCREPDGTPIAGFGDLVIVETKSDTKRPGPLDSGLWRTGVRPVSISKYAVGVACARPDLTANRWRRVIRRYVASAPDGGPISRSSAT